MNYSFLFLPWENYFITGYPMRISHEKYPRNFLIFNLCFVCDSDARTVQYELVVRKLAEHLVTLEMEQNFLSTETNRAKLPQLLGQILSDLNRGGMCTLTGKLDFTPTHLLLYLWIIFFETVGPSKLHLKVIQVAAEPPLVFDHHVPVFTSEFAPLKQDYWDLTTKQVQNCFHFIYVFYSIFISLLRYCLMLMDEVMWLE